MSVGTAGAAPLVLLHPVGSNGASFAFLGLDAAKAGVPVVTPDMLGHGIRNRWPGMTLADVAADVAGQVPGPFHVAGFSFGGMVALALALRYPQRVRSLLVACAPAKVDPDVILARAEAAEAGGMAAVVPSTLERWFTPAALADPRNAAVNFSRTTLLALDPYAFADGWRAIAGHDVTGRLGDLQLPVTALAGRADVSAPPAQVRQISDGVAGAHYVEVDGPHMAYLENPTAVAAEIIAHLRRTLAT